MPSHCSLVKSNHDSNFILLLTSNNFQPENMVLNLLAIYLPVHKTKFANWNIQTCHNKRLSLFKDVYGNIYKRMTINSGPR